MNLLLSRSSRRVSRLWAESGLFFCHSSALWGSVYLDGRVGIIHPSAWKVNSPKFASALSSLDLFVSLWHSSARGLGGSRVRSSTLKRSGPGLQRPHLPAGLGPLFTQRPRRVILGSSAKRSSPKYASNQVNNSATYGCSRAWQKCAAEDEQALLLAEDVKRHAYGTP
jgi:hypothetical protein